MRKIKKDLVISLGFVHSRIGLLVTRNIIIFIDLSNGSRKKKYKYIITEVGYAYKVELMQKIKEFMLIELEYMKKFDINKGSHEFFIYPKLEDKILENQK